MSVELVQYAFIAGEISPSLFGRTDLTKYDLAMAKAHNFFVDYRGGLSSRPGFEFCEFVEDDDPLVRMFPFNFSPDLSNSYAMLFGANYIRFLQNGSYVLEDGQAIESISTSTFTITGHGYATGDWVKITGVVGATQLNGRTFRVSRIDNDNFTLRSLPYKLTAADTADYTSGGTVSRIYTVTTVYDSSDLANLVVEQYRDNVRITSPVFPVYSLTRSDHTDWTLAEEDISPYNAGPSVSSSSASATGSANVLFAVSSVYKDGTESALGTPNKLSSIINYSATEGSVTVNWAADVDASYYKVWRSVISSSEALDSGAELGYVGRSWGTQFVDPNIIPDFTQSPAENYDPFQPGAITEIEITDPGTGYAQFTTTITITDSTGSGSGFVGFVIVDASGTVVNVIIKNAGANYETPVVAFGGAGADAAATATARPMTGTYPRLSAVFQQRQIYAATDNDPINIWGSQIKKFSVFDTTPLALDSDSLEYTLDAKGVAPIRHLVVTRGGLLAMTQENIWLLHGGGSNEPLTPSNALAEPQTYKGASTLKPILLDNDILYVEGKGHAVQMLTYNEMSRVYGSEDKSILSNHLFKSGKDLVRWSYQESPHKVVWAVREDGWLIAFTSAREEDVFAWCPGSTKGLFKDLIGVREGIEDRIYVTVQRYIESRWRVYIERMDLRVFTNVEDAFCVDSGLRLEGNTSTLGDLTIVERNGNYFARSTSHDFGGKEGWFIRGGDAILKITEVLNNRLVRLEVFAQPTNWIPEQHSTTEDMLTAPLSVGSWTLDEPVSSLSGLWHLEGEEVQILGDGNVFASQVVVGGKVVLPQPVTRANVGLKFVCSAQTLPVIVPEAAVEARRKRVVGLAVRLDKSRGLRLGPDLDNLIEVKERTDEQYGHPTRLVNGIKYTLLRTDWNELGQTMLEQSYPLPLNLLSMVYDVEFGDEPD